MSRPVAPPGFAQHLYLLWKLRFDLGLNRSGGGRWWLSVGAFLLSASPAVGAAMSFFAIMHLPVVVASKVWPDFIVRILAFVTTCVWATWPLLSGGVDDHSEVSRFAAFPISSFRLLIASTLASLFEPRAIVFYGPLVGALLGYAHTHPVANPLLTVGCFTAFVIANACISRVGLNSMLTVLRQPRSAELIGGGFAVSLLVATLIPPVDTSWLFNVSAGGMSAVPDTLLDNAVFALGRFPTGWAVRSLRVSWALAVTDLFGLLEIALFSLVVAWGLLVDFHRQTGRGGGGPRSETQRAANPFIGTRTVFSTLVMREALDLFHNARARLLVSVPFVLGILLKLLSARSLFVAFLGESADLWVLGGLSSYGALVMASTFSQNAFAYDGHGMTIFLTAPQRLGDVLRAKNLVHALAAVGLSVAVVIFYLMYFGAGSLLDVLCVAFAMATLIPGVIAAGNFLSVTFPVKFHANLKRRDKLPFIASMLGVAAAAVSSAPFAFVVRSLGREGPQWAHVGLLAISAVLSVTVYRLSAPWAMRLLEGRRELILRAVTRE